MMEGAMSKGSQMPLEAGKGKEAGSHLELPEEAQPYPYLGVSPERTFADF